MAFTFRAANTVGSGASPRTVTNPALEGDLLIAQVSSTTNVAPTPPSGFVEVVAARNETINTVRVYWKIQEASPPADYTWTFASGSGHTVGMMAWDMDAGHTAEVDDADTQSNPSGNRICPSVDASQAGCLLGSFVAVVGNIGSTAPGGTDERWDTGSSPRIWAGTRVVAGTGATGTTTATGTASANQGSSVLFKEVALDAPSDLAATPISSTEIDLSWTDTATGEDGWKIERSPAGAGTWVQIDSIAADSISYSDTGLTLDTSYDYRVRSFVGATNGSYSNTATAKTNAVLTAPSDLAALAISDSEIDLSWSDTASGEDGWKIERSPAGAGTWVQIDSIAAGSTSYSDTGLTPSTAYDYRIRAFDGATNGSYSNTATETTEAAISAPYDVSALAISSTVIVLEWASDDDPGNFDGFSIERSLTGVGDWAEVDTVPSNVLIFYDSGLTPATEYFYRIRAFIND